MAIFDIKTDLVVKYYDGTNWNQIQADTFEVEIDRGITVEQQVFARPDIGTAVIRMRTANLAPFMTSPPYTSDMDVSIEAQSEVLFTGLIQNVSMSYVVETKELEVIITANDYTKLFLNTILSSYSVSGTTTNKSFKNQIINVGNAIQAIDARVVLLQFGTAGSSTYERAFTWLDTPAGEIVTQFSDAELAWIFCDKDGQMRYMTRADVDARQATSWDSTARTISNIHSTATKHICMDTIDMSYDSDDLVNVVAVTDTGSSTTKTKTNTTSVNTYGRQEATFEITYDITLGSSLQDWADTVAAAANPKSIKSVSVPAVRRDGELSSVIKVDIGFNQQVEFQATGYTTLQEIYLVSRIRHNITAEHWEVSLDLWRGI